MSKSASRHITFIALFIIYLGIVAYLCFGHPTAFFKIPRTITLLKWTVPTDKFIRFLMFFPYPFLAQAAFYFKNRWRSLVFVILTGLAFCFTFELLQDVITQNLPYKRTSDPWDLSINVAAVSIGSLIVSIYSLFRK
ncbi:MAG: hypothetical protein IKX03_00830 [Bacteroidales bacterium]|nr:hypothetical protein [Bacteroidales bacterium]